MTSIMEKIFGKVLVSHHLATSAAAAGATAVLPQEAEQCADFGPGMFEWIIDQDEA